MDIRDLEIALANIKTDIALLENTIEALKEKDQYFNEGLKSTTEDITKLRFSISDKFSRVTYDLKDLQNIVNRFKEDLINGNNISNEKYLGLKHDIEKINDRIERLSSNSLLEFTKELDAKKIITIVLILLSLVSSPNIVSSWLDQSNSSSEKLDTLLKLLEEKDANSSP